MNQEFPDYFLGFLDSTDSYIQLLDENGLPAVVHGQAELTRLFNPNFGANRQLYEAAKE